MATLRTSRDKFRNGNLGNKSKTNFPEVFRSEFFIFYAAGDGKIF
jgi:hypothetical protein